MYTLMTQNIGTKATVRAWIIKSYNAEALYAYGAQWQMDIYLELLNFGRDINCWEATVIPDPEVPQHPANWTDLTDGETQDWIDSQLGDLETRSRFADR